MPAPPPSTAERTLPPAIEPYQRLEYCLNNNRTTLRRIAALMRPRQRPFLSLLPILFAANHPLLPGFVSRETPVGVADYTPDQETLAQVRRLSRTFSYRRDHRRPALLGIYFIGSPGSIAHTASSDFDIWLCHHPDLDVWEQSQLVEKGQLIEKWAASMGVEAHFFLVNPQQFRDNCSSSELSIESSGSAQHYLLREEFYRTAVLVAGQPPLWWLLPAEEEQNYTAWTTDLLQRRMPQVGRCIDFGALDRIPAAEFFGAALWQLTKGIDAPYKSALKLLLVESYASEHPDCRLLSVIRKERIHRGEVAPERLDPYLLLLQKVEHYLRHRNEQQRLLLARRCFYLKVQRRSDDATRERLLQQIVAGWRWQQSEWRWFDERHTLSIPQRIAEQQQLFQMLLESYRFLSDFARAHPGDMNISEHHLTILGRRLYAVYEQREGKLDLLQSVVPLDERQVFTLREFPVRQGGSGWRLFPGVFDANQPLSSAVAVRSSHSVVSLIAWGWCNAMLAGNSSNLLLQASASDLKLREIQRLLLLIRNLLPLTDLRIHDLEPFQQPAQLVRSALLINVGINDRQRDALLSASGGGGRRDPLSYGPERENLLLRLDDLQLSSWGEVYSRHYDGNEGLVAALCNYLRWLPAHTERPGGALTDTPLPPPTLLNIGIDRGLTLSQRLEQLFGEVAAAFSQYENAALRYLLRVGRTLYLLQREQLHMPAHAQHFDDESALFAQLARPLPHHRPLQIDPFAFDEPWLALLARQHRPGWLLLSSHPPPYGQHLLILDEWGALYRYQFRRGESPAQQLAHYHRFLRCCKRQLSTISDLICYQGEIEADGTPQLNYQSPSELDSDHGAPLLATLDGDAQGRPRLQLQIGDHHFDSAIHTTAELGALLRQWQVQHHAPLRISELQLGESIPERRRKQPLHTLIWLRYKRRIEDQLDRALSE